MNINPTNANSARRWRKGDRVWALVDGLRVNCIYDCYGGGGLHFVHTNDLEQIPYMLSASEISSRG